MGRVVETEYASVKNVLGQEVQVKLRWATRGCANWDDYKPLKKECMQCPKYISQEIAETVLLKVERIKTDWERPTDQRGICLQGNDPKYLTPAYDLRIRSCSKFGK